MNFILGTMNDKVNPPDPNKRRYDASQRRAAATTTRTSILAAARTLFIERGYVATTMAAIADFAGVALDTVYASVGPKPQLFRLLIESAIDPDHRNFWTRAAFGRFVEQVADVQWLGGSMPWTVCVAKVRD